MRLPSTFISINNFLPMAHGLSAPQPGWFSLTVLYTVHETCRMCDVVMDTLKKISPSRLSTLPTLCWTEKGILTSPHIISKLSCFPIWGSYFPASFFFFVIGNPARELCLLLPRNDPSAVAAYFFQTFQERKKKPSFKHFVAAPYRASPTLDHILLLAGPAGWCCVWCHGPSARGPGLNFPWQLKSALLRCPSDSRLQRCSFEETEGCN